MRIRVEDLSSEIKNIVRALIKEHLIKEMGYCPLASEEGLIKEHITPELCEIAKKRITDYYEQELGFSVECNISEQEFVLIYLNRV